MNRKQRRRFAKKTKGTKPFYKHFKTLVGESPKGVDKTNAHFCWLHNIQFENPKHPTERDKNIGESIRLRPFKSKDPSTGEITMGRTCPRCGNTVYADTKKTAKSKPSIQGYTTRDSEFKLGTV